PTAICYHFSKHSRIDPHSAVFRQQVFNESTSGSFGHDERTGWTNEIDKRRKHVCSCRNYGIRCIIFESSTDNPRVSCRQVVRFDCGLLSLRRTKGVKIGFRKLCISNLLAHVDEMQIWILTEPSAVLKGGI